MAEAVTLHDLTFRPYIDKVEIDRAVARLATDLNTRFEGRRPLFVVVLNGAFVFGADLFKQLRCECEVAFIRVSSYRGTSSTGEVREEMPIGADVRGRDVIIVEDIIDTGLTMGALRQRVKGAGASSVTLVSLLYKPDAFKGDYPIDHIGIEIPDRFVVGYGLDYDGLGRNLPLIYQLDPTSKAL
jgi:hypoxanthine phosphoribosyltransferase